MLTKNDIIIIENTEEKEITAEYFTMQAWKTRNYRVKDLVSQNKELQEIKIGFIAEFSLTEFLCCELSTHYDSNEFDWSINKAELNDRIILLVCINDLKTKRSLIEKTIDLKTHYSKKITVEEILGLEPYNKPCEILLENLNYPKTDYTVQAFLLADNSIALAGYTKKLTGKHSSKAEFYNRIRVTELYKMKNLINELLPADQKTLHI